MLKRLTLTGSTLRPRTPEQKAEIGKSLAREVWPLLDQGRIKPVVDSVFPLEKVADAHARMAGSQHIGKILLSLV
jgi:NADPH2:quinone reductase